MKYFLIRIIKRQCRLKFIEWYVLGLYILLYVNFVLYEEEKNYRKILKFGN